MLYKLKSYLIDRKFYWRLKRDLNKLRNSLLRGFIKRKENDVSSFFKLIWLSLKAIVISLVMCLVMYILDSFLLDSLNGYWLNKLKIQSENYITFLATIAGVGGVFIALYFNALSSIASTVYSDVPNDIRSLLKRDEIGRSYMGLVTVVTLTSIILIGINLMGFPPLKLIIVVILFLAAFSVSAFYQLGIKAFNFFDPTSLSRVLFRDIFKSIEKVSSKNRFYKYSVVQKHHYRISRENLFSIRKLVDLCINQEHLSNKPLTHLSSKLIELLNLYLIAKSYIPLQSEWYETKYEQKDWYKTSFSELNIALSTGTSVQPKEAKDNWWFEDEIHEILLKVFGFYLEQGNFDSAFQIIKQLQNINLRLGSISELEKGLNYWDDYVQIFESKVNEERVEVIGIAENLYTFPINLLLGYVKSGLFFCKRDYLTDLTNQIEWNNHRQALNIYKPFYLLERVNWLKNTIQNEEFVEGGVVTPKWYQFELINQESLFKLKENVKGLLSKPRKVFQRSNKKFLAEKYYWLSSSILSREMEFVSKLKTHLSSILEEYENSTEERHLNDLPWPDLPGNKVYDSLENLKKDLTNKLVSVIEKVSSKEKPLDYPDYTGQFINVLSEEVVDALTDNDEERFEYIFSSLFNAMYSKHLQLKPKPSTPKWKLESEVKTSAAPLIDLIDLSGYALLFSKFHQNIKFWDIVKNSWDKHFNSYTKERLEYIAGHIFLTHSRFSLTDFGVKITDRKQTISRFLNQVDRIQIEKESHFLSHIEIPNHESSLVRVFVPNRMSMIPSYDGIDIFIELYLAADYKEHFDDLEFGRKGKGRLKDSIKTEEESNQNHFSDEEDD